MRPCCALVLLTLACSGPPETAATAFPDHRPSYPLDGHLRAYVSNSLSDTIGIVDLDAMALLGSPPVGRDPVDVDGPSAVAVDRARGLIYVALSYPTPGGEGPHAAHGDAPRRGYLQALAIDDLRPLGELPAYGRPGDLSLTDDGGQLLVPNADPAATLPLSAPLEQRRSTLVMVDPAPAMVTGDARIKQIVVCVSPAAVVYQPARARAFVACAGEDALASVDTAAASVIARVPADDGPGVAKPGALVANATGTRLVLSNRVARQVVLFTSDDTPVRLISSTTTIGVPYFSVWLSDAEILVPTQSPSGAVVVDVATGALTRQIGYGDDECASPRQAWRARDGRVFLLCEGDDIGPGAVARIDPATLVVQARTAVGIGPEKMTVLEP